MHIMKFRMVQKLCEYRRISIKESQVGAFISTDRLSVDKLIEICIAHCQSTSFEPDEIRKESRARSAEWTKNCINMRI